MDEYGARTVDAFCTSVGIKRTTFYKLVTQGQIKTVKAGGRTLVRHEDGQAWLNNLPSSSSPISEPAKAKAKAAARAKKRGLICGAAS